MNIFEKINVNDVFFLKQRETQYLIEEILRVTKSSNNNNKIDFLCVEFSEKLIDEIPVNDPRWAEVGQKSKSFSSNLIISNQLKGKLKFHEYYMTFLKKYQIWDKVRKKRQKKSS